MSNAYTNAGSRMSATPQTQPAFGREKEQVQNNAGGYTFTLDPMAQVRRFLILGTEGGTYYVKQGGLTIDNAKTLREVLASDNGPAAVELIKDISVKGLAAKVSPALFALAMAMASDNKQTRKAAAVFFRDIVRTNSHMLEFVSYVNGMRGWGRLLRDTVAGWYNTMPPGKLAYQVAKYQTRKRWNTRDVLRMAKPSPSSPERNQIYGWVAGKSQPGKAALIHQVVDRLKFYSTVTKQSTGEVVNDIVDYGLTREMIPTMFLKSPEVWEALLVNMPMTAMIRNLGVMTSVGLIKPMGEANGVITERLADQERLQKARIHPMGTLIALKTYQTGRGLMGSLTWGPDQKIVDALNEAFYMTWKNVTPTGKRTLLALDVSGSMGWEMAGAISAREVSAAMALVTAATEESCYIHGFSYTFVELPISPKQRLDDVIREVSYLSFGATNCSLPMVWALKNRLLVDTFVVYTDNEAWDGYIHPHQALEKYSHEMGVEAKLVVVGVTATKFTIADPKNPNMLDLVGFDASAPAAISNFSRGI